MNKIFRVIWNANTQSWSVTSELAKGHVKSSSSSNNSIKTGVLSALTVVGALTSVSNDVEAAIAISGNSAATSGVATNSPTNNVVYEKAYVYDGYGYNQANLKTLYDNYYGAPSGVYAGAGQISTDSNKDNAILNLHNPGSRSYSDPDNNGTNAAYYANQSLEAEGIAIGRAASAVGSQYRGIQRNHSNLAIGEFSRATGGWATALGSYSQAWGDSAIAVGISTNAYGEGSLAMMRQAAAAGNYSMAMGVTSWAEGAGGIAMGYSATAYGNQSIAIGSSSDPVKYNNAGTPQAIYDGINNTNASGEQSIAIGAGSKSIGEKSTVLGFKSITNNENGIALGSNVESTGNNATAIGAKAKATAKDTIAIGAEVNATSEEAVSIGYQANATAINAAALGGQSNATGANSTAIGDNANASAANTTAIGASAASSQENATAIGTNANATGKNASSLGTQAQALANSAVAIGDSANATQNYATAIGGNANATGVEATAIGRSAQALQVATVAIGVEANASQQNAMAIGSKANATAANTTSIGQNANASSTYATAIGSDAKALGESTISLGYNSSVANTGKNSIAMGTNANVTGANSLAIGSDSKALATGAVALGSNSNVSANNGTAIGLNTKVSGANSTAIGVNSNVSATDSVAIGNATQASSKNAIAMGTETKVSGDDSISIGLKSNVSGNASIGVGSNNNVTGNNTAALGNGIYASFSGAVYLGDRAEGYDVKAGQVVNGGRVQQNITKPSGTNHTYSFAGAVQRDGSFVSIGRKGDERKLINLAAGQVDKDSTEAINGSQLYAVAVRAETGWNIAENSNPKPEANIGLGDNVSFNDSNTVKVKVSKNSNGGANVTFDVSTSGISVNNNGSTKTDEPTKASTSFVTAQNLVNTINNAGWQLQEKGTTKQIVSAGDQVNFIDGKGTSVSIVSNTQTGASTVQVSVANTTLVPNNNGSVVVPTGDNVNKIVNAGDLANTLNNLSFNATVGKNKTLFNDGDGKTNTKITAGKTVVFNSGKNLKVKQDGSNFTYATEDNVTFANVNTTTLVVGDPADKNKSTTITSSPAGLNVGGDKITNVAPATINATSTDAVNGSQLYDYMYNSAWTLNAAQDGAAVKVGDVKRNSTVTINGEKNITVTGKQNGTDNIVNIAVKTTNATTNNGKATYDPKSANPSDPDAVITAKNMIDTLNNVSWNINSAAVNGGVATGSTNTAVKAGELVTLQAGKNMAVAQSGRTFTYATADNVTFNNVNTTKLVVGNSTDPNASTTITSVPEGLNIGGDRITNVAPGEKSTDAVNVEQLGNVSWDLTTAANGGKVQGTTVERIKTNNTVTLVAGDNIALRQKGSNVTIETSISIPDAASSNITVNNQTGVASSDGNKLAKSDNVANSINQSGWILQENGAQKDVVNPGNIVNFASTDTVKVKIDTTNGTNSKVAFNINNTELNVDPNTGKVTVPNGNSSSLVNAGDIVKTLNNMSFTATVDKYSGAAFNETVVPATAEKITAGSKVVFQSGNNLVVKQEGKNFTYATNNEVTFNTTNTTNLVVGNPADPNNTTTLTSGPDGLNVNNANITNVKGADTLDGSVNKDGTPLVKVGNDYYKANDVIDGKPVTNAEKQTPSIKNEAYNGLADLANANRSNAATAGDLKNLGWVVSDDKGYSDDVRHTNEVKFVGDGLVDVTGSTNATTGVRTITVDIKTGNLTTGGGNITNASNGLATVDNVVKAINDSGWNIRGNNEKIGDGIVNPSDTVNFANGKGTTANITATNGSFTVAYDVANTTLAPNENGSVKAPDADNATKFVNAGDLANTLNNMGYTATIGRDDNAFADQAGKANQQIKAGSTVVFNAGKNLVVKQDGSNFTYATADNVTFNNVNSTSITIGDTTNASAPTTNLTSTNGGLDIGGDKITNVTAGSNTYTGVVDKNGNPLTVINGKHYAADQFENGVLKPNAVETAAGNVVNKGALPNAYNGIADLTNSTASNAATVDDLKNVGWVVTASDNGYADDVRNANQVDFKGVNGVVVTGNTTEDGTRTITVGVKKGTITTVNDANMTYTPAGSNVALVVKKFGDKYYTADKLDNYTGLPKPDATPLTDAQVKNIQKGSTAGEGYVTGEQTGEAIQASGWSIGKATTAQLSATEFRTNSVPIEKVNPNDDVRFAAGTGVNVDVGYLRDATDATGAVKTTSVVKISTQVGGLTVDDKGKVSAKQGEGSGYVNATTVADVINKTKKNVDWKLTSGAVDGGESVGSTVSQVASGDLVTLQAGKNMRVVQAGQTVTYATKDDVEFNRVQAKDVIANSVTSKRVKVQDGGSLTVGKNANINMGNNQIHNVKAGTADTDAVNVSQLKQVRDDANKRIKNAHDKVDNVEKKVRGGVASAYSAALLPQVFMPGKSLVGASVGHYKGKSAVAVGYSRASDDGKIIIRMAGSLDANGDVASGASMGYQW